MLQNIYRIASSGALCSPKNVLQLRLVSASLSTAVAASKVSPPRKLAEKWDLYASVLVERLPIVSRGLNDLEREFQDQLWRIEFEKSFKSDHELKHEQDLIQSDLIKKGKVEVDLDDSASKQTAQDLKDAYSEELKNFKFALRGTADDTANKASSTDRCLEETLYLVLEEKLGNKMQFLLPQGPRLEGETMRQTAERVLREKCGEDLVVRFYGNAPCGFYKYKYPNEMREHKVGAKVFFFRAALRNGNVDPAATKKHEWLVKEALEQKLQHSSYAESIDKFLL